MRKQVDWNLLAKYLAGECTDEEEAKVNAWLAEKPEHRQQLTELEEVWDVTAPQASEHDVDRLWNRVQDHIRDSRSDTSPETERRSAIGRGAEGKSPDRRPARSVRRDRAPERGQRGGTARRIFRATAFAAAVVGTLLVALWMGYGAGLGVFEEDGQVFTTERGQRATVRLADGTLVRMNAESELALAPDFGATDRVVRLEGEAYFDVASDSSRPFIVHAGQATARVLGTGFNVTAYPDESRVRVVVAEGHVAFQAEHAAGETPGAVLQARQMGELDGRGRLVTTSTDVQPHIDWMDGYLHFRGAPFEEVARRLSRFYDLDVMAASDTAPAGHLSARFSDEQPLAEVLSVIAAVFELRYEHTSGAVHFYPLEDAPQDTSRST